MTDYLFLSIHFPPCPAYLSHAIWKQLTYCIGLYQLKWFIGGKNYICQVTTLSTRALVQTRCLNPTLALSKPSQLTWWPACLQLTIPFLALSCEISTFMDNPTKLACEVRTAPTYKHFFRPYHLQCGTDTNCWGFNQGSGTNNNGNQQTEQSNQQ